jgi:hypothetical protein
MYLMTWIAAGALIVSVATFGWTVWRDKVTRAALKQETRDRKEQIEREDGRREEELRLLRVQVERQADEMRAAQDAHLIGKSPGRHYGGIGNIAEYPVSVQNVGPAVARDVRVWLALATPDADPDSAPTVASAEELGALAPNDEPARFSLIQGDVSSGGGVPRDGWIVASWKDDSGEWVETIGKLTVFL